MALYVCMVMDICVLDGFFVACFVFYELIMIYIKLNCNIECLYFVYGINCLILKPWGKKHFSE